MNCESAQSSNKRIIEDDELSQPDKQFKQENKNVLIERNLIPRYEEEIINLANVDKNCEIKESKNRNTYTDFIAKFEVPFEQFEKENTNFIEKLTSKNKDDYFFSLSNILYEGTVSSSLIFLFQNKPGLSEEEFHREILSYENNFMVCSSEALEKSNESLIKFTKEEEKNNNEKIKIGKINYNDKDGKISKICEHGYHVDSDSKENINSEYHLVNGYNKIKSEVENNEIIGEKYKKEFNKKINNDFVQTSIEGESNNKNKFEFNTIKDTKEQNRNENENMDVEEYNDSKHSKQQYNNRNFKALKTKNYLPLHGLYHKSFEESWEKKSCNGNTENINNLSNNNSLNQNNINLVEGQNFNSHALNIEKENHDLNSKESYDIQINLYLSDFKIIQKNFQKVKESEILELQIDIPTNFYTSYKGEGVIIISEVIIRKNFDTLVKYNGIINEAMTCYMNSLIQTLFNIGYFKKAVFQIPLDSSENLGESVVYSLQRLFYDLMTEKTPASTNKLINSFGWSREEIFIQHDVQEFNLMLNDLMENKMKGTKSEGTFKYLFEGTHENYIECIDIPYRSNKVEKFYDLQLTVKNCKNIYESIDMFTGVETLEDENMYEAEGHGKQRARKGIRFLEFPKVLMFQLKRFEYNPMKDSMEKINEMFEFPNELILDKYISNSGSKSAQEILNENKNKFKYEYSLYSVVVHKGTIDRGHYYAFIKPENGCQWYQFNDEIVRKADLYEVFSNNYGGYFKIYKHKEKGIITEVTHKSDGSAYLLVYIRKDFQSEILQKVTEEDIPQDLIERFKKEKEYEKRQAMLRVRSRKNMDIHLFSKEILLNHMHLGAMPSILELQDVSDLLSNNTSWVKISVPKEMKLIELREYISKLTNIPEKYILLFTYVIRDQKNIYKNILKRHEFKMHLIDEKGLQDQKIATINNYNELKPVFKNIIFIFIDFALKSSKDILENNLKFYPKNYMIFNELRNLELQVFEKNEDFDIESSKNFEDITEGEYIIDESQQKNIYYKFDNYWKFKKHDNLTDQIFNILKYEDKDYDNFRLFIVKEIITHCGEIRVKISNAFSLPVLKDSDLILEELLLKSTKENKINLIPVAEAIKKDDIRNFSVGIYLETTVFEPESSNIIKKLSLSYRKKEKKFYEELEKKNLKDSLLTNLSEEKTDKIEIKNNFHLKQKENNNENLGRSNNVMSLQTNNKNFHKTINSNDINSNNKISSTLSVTGISVSKQLQENLVLSPDFEKKKAEININRAQTFSKYQNYTSKDILHNDSDTINRANDTNKLNHSDFNNTTTGKAYSRMQVEHENSSSQNINSDKNSETERPKSFSRGESVNYSENQKSEINLSNYSQVKEVRDEIPESSLKMKLQNSPSDNNSMVINHNLSPEDEGKKGNPNMNKTKSFESTNTNKNGRVKNFRRILGAKRLSNNEREITYKNLSSLNQNENEQINEELKENLNNYQVKESASGQHETVDLPDEEESLTNEDQILLEQEASILDEFLFKIDSLSKQKIFNFNNISKEENEKNISNNESLSKDFENNLNQFNLNYNYMNFDNFPNVNDIENINDNVFKTSLIRAAFSKSNSDALIFFLFPERENNLHIINQWIPKEGLYKVFEDLFNSVYIPIEFIFFNKCKELYGPKGNSKFKLLLNEDPDVIIKRVFEQLDYNFNNYNLDQIFFQDEIIKNILFYTEHRKLINLNMFLRGLTPEYLYIRPCINLDQIPNHTNSYHFMANLINRYPLLQYMDSKDSLYKLTCQLFPCQLEYIRKLMIKDVLLFDIESNPMLKIYFCFPIELRECNEYLEFISNDVLTRFYEGIFNTNDKDSEDDEDLRENINETIKKQKKLSTKLNEDILIEVNDRKDHFNTDIKNNKLFESCLEGKECNNYDNENRKMNSEKGVKKNLIDLDSDSNIINNKIPNDNNYYKKEKKISIKLENFKFMLQHQKRLFAYDMFIGNDEELFRYERHSLNISYRIQPLTNEELYYLNKFEKIFVAFCRRDTTAFCDPLIISLPNETTIGEMKKVIFNKIKKIKSTQFIEYCKIKFYIYSLVEYRPHKDNLLINSKDDEKIAQFFKRGPRNVLVELLQTEAEISGKELIMG